MAVVFNVFYLVLPDVISLKLCTSKVVDVVQVTQSII
jgi:hypothetical protein